MPSRPWAGVEFGEHHLDSRKSGFRLDINRDTPGAITHFYTVVLVQHDAYFVAAASKRLVDSASVLVADEGQAGANMERIMKMMDERAQQAKRILEVNPKHAIVQNLAILAKTELHSDRVKAYSELLLDQALLAEGVVENPAALVGRIQDLLVQATTAAAASSAKPAEPKPAEPKPAEQT